MKFSTRTLYGLKAVLVLAGRYGEGSLSVSQIAKRENISIPYLEQILNALKKKGFVKSVRGPQGGYVLSKKPADTDLKDLFYALDEGKLPVVKPKEPVSAESDEVTLANLLFWKKFENALETGLSEMTLKDLIDESRRVKKGKPASSHTFNI